MENKKDKKMNNGKALIGEFYNTKKAALDAAERKRKLWRKDFGVLDFKDGFFVVSQQQLDLL